MTRAVLLLFAVAGLLAVAVLRRREPVPTADLTFREDDDGIQPPDPGLLPGCTCPSVGWGPIAADCPVHTVSWPPADPMYALPWSEFVVHPRVQKAMEAARGTHR